MGDPEGDSGGPEEEPPRGAHRGPPLEYAAFEGEIPQGQYGAGLVKIWDRGTYECEKWTDREVKVVLHGKRARGRYVLFQTRGDNWMIHRMDPPDT